ncbi:hypothetical protein F5Y15DRAFT_384712 [Xylariaceae sp. FL0016]|nr:hypothetical protein F5Y15DRAFT_384712 [Xylariaceae sp. FL0016]
MSAYIPCPILYATLCWQVLSALRPQESCQSFKDYGDSEARRTFSMSPCYYPMRFQDGRLGGRTQVHVCAGREVKQRNEREE